MQLTQAVVSNLSWIESHITTLQGVHFEGTGAENSSLCNRGGQALSLLVVGTGAALVGTGIAGSLVICWASNFTQEYSKKLIEDTFPEMPPERALSKLRVLSKQEWESLDPQVWAMLLTSKQQRPGRRRQIADDVGCAA